MQRIKALHKFSGAIAGAVEPGEVLEVNPGYARHLVEHGAAEYTNEPLTRKPVEKEKTKLPLVNGRGKKSGASRRVRASEEKTASDSEESES